MQLEYEYYPAQKPNSSPPLIVLHGLFGSSTNWRTICKSLAGDHANYALDLRNHGASPHDASMTFTEMADDVFEFIREHKLPPGPILGHSLGGKIAMQAALTRPEQFSRLIVVDIAPKTYPPRHGDIFAAIDAIHKNPVRSRQQADTLIKHILPDQAVRLFLLNNLRRGDNGQFGWRINIDAIRDNYTAISDAPKPPLPDTHYDKPTLFIKGGLSPYIKDEDTAIIHTLFPHAQIETIRNAGHWVHAEQPENFLHAVKAFLAI